MEMERRQGARTAPFYSAIITSDPGARVTSISTAPDKKHDVNGQLVNKLFFKEKAFQSQF